MGDSCEKRRNSLLSDIMYLNIADGEILSVIVRTVYRVMDVMEGERGLCF